MEKTPLAEVFQAYRLHPEFLGLAITDVNQKGALDGTLLHVAARKGRLDHVIALVGAGAELDARGDLGNTPLHDAALCGQAAAVEFLLASGADRSLKNEFGETAFDIARHNGDEKVCGLLRGGR